MSSVAERIELEIEGQTVIVERLDNGTFCKPAYLAGAEREVVSIREEYAQRANKERRGVSWADNTLADGSFSHPEQIGQITAPATPSAQLWDGYGTALKPAWEPIILAMKPREGTFANNALEWGVAGLNIDGCRIGPYGVLRSTGSIRDREDGWRFNGGIVGGNSQGRWPANLVLDETAARLLDEQSGTSTSSKDADRFKGRPKFNGTKYAADKYSLEWESGSVPVYGDTGGASRFFYCAKASRRERNDGLHDFVWKIEDKTYTRFYSRAAIREFWRWQEERQGLPGRGFDKWLKACGQPSRRRRNRCVWGNIHPTVKPLGLCRWLCRLVKPPTGGVMLDLFMGSGSICVAAIMEGWEQVIGIDIERASFEIAQARIGHAEPVVTQTQLCLF